MKKQIAEIPGADGWTVYILECGDGTYYTGIARDLEKRIGEHRSGKGAKYLRGRGPLEIVFSKKVESHGSALKYEIKIKKLPRPKKTTLISDPSQISKLLNEQG